MPNCVDLWSDLKSLQTDRSTTLEVTLQEHTLQTHIKISDSGGLMSLLEIPDHESQLTAKKKKHFFPVEQRIMYVVCVVWYKTDEKFHSLLILIDTGLHYQRGEFVSVVWYFSF